MGNTKRMISFDLPLKLSVNAQNGNALCLSTIKQFHTFPNKCQMVEQMNVQKFLPSPHC